jgi:glycosyltransferase involved in cell wall biosynthesis
VSSGLRLAIASSGLGHIRRGIESWAEDLGSALRRAGENVTLFQGAGKPAESWRRTLPCLRRFERPSARLLSLTQKAGGWRYGFGSGYEVEQSTFAVSLWKAIRHDYDILHVQDPLVARRLDSLNRAGRSRPRVILAHGTEEPEDLLKRYSHLQHLTPGYRDDWEAHRPPRQLAFGIPNFIDTDKFKPGDKKAARESFDLPMDALVIVSVAALKRHHKRCDYLIREFAEFRRALSCRALLVLAGARENETQEVMELGKSLLDRDVIFFESLDRSRLRSLYQAADIFALASLHEMMPIALLEALASGLPITCNNTPTMSWMAGPSGDLEDISAPAGLVRQWQKLEQPGCRAERAHQARTHAEQTFSEGVVIRQILSMYDAVNRANPQ